MHFLDAHYIQKQNTSGTTPETIARGAAPDTVRATHPCRASKVVPGHARLCANLGLKDSLCNPLTFTTSALEDTLITAELQIAAMLNLKYRPGHTRSREGHRLSWTPMATISHGEAARTSPANPHRWTALLGVAVVIFLFSIDSGPGHAQTKPLAAHLLEAQELLRAGKIQPALTLLEDAIKASGDLLKEKLYLQEELHWQVAMARLELAEQLTNEKQRRSTANRARDAWREYVDWYHGLSTADRLQLPPNHSRIPKATRFLGNVGLLTGDRHQVLEDYKNIQDVVYLGTDAIDLWKAILYECPDWIAGGQRSSEARRKKVCTDSCKEDWLVYADTLAEWAPKFNLRTAARQGYLREATQITAAAKVCPLP